MQELLNYLDLLVKQYNIDDQPEIYERIKRVNDEIERLLGVDGKRNDTHAQDAVRYAMVSALYEQKESPLRYGIMYQVGSYPSEIKWVASRLHRDEAIKKLAETGELSIENATRTVGRIIRPHSFAAVDMPETYFSRKAENADWCKVVSDESKKPCNRGTSL